MSLDPNTKVLLHFNGANGATTTIDEVGSAIVFTGSAQLSDVSPKFGSTALLCNPTDGMAVIQKDFEFGYDDFTIDFWLKPNNLDAHVGIISNYNGSYVRMYAMLTPAGSLNIQQEDGQDNYIYAYNTPDGAVVVGEWQHIAYIRNGANFFIFVNGIAQTLTVTVPIENKFVRSNGANFGVGGIWNEADQVPNNPCNAYIDEFRISQGVARWTSNFVPPTSEYSSSSRRSSSPMPMFFRGAVPPPPESASFVANFQGTDGQPTYTSESGQEIVLSNLTLSSAQAKFGSTSLRIDPYAGTATSIHSPLFDLGTGDFTIEAFVYINSDTGCAAQHFFSMGDTSMAGGGNAWTLGFMGGSRVVMFNAWDGNAGIQVFSDNGLAMETWHHIAVVRTAGRVSLLINGAERGSGLISSSLTNAEYLLFGNRQTQYAAEYFDGYVGGMRIAKSAMYSGAFITVPTEVYPSGSPVAYPFQVKVGGWSSFQLPLMETGTYDMTVNWGDGTSDVITAWDAPEATHAYPDGRYYVASITGTCTKFSFSNTAADRSVVVGVVSFKDLGFDTLDFDGCWSFSSTAKLGAMASLTSANRMFNSTALTSVPVDMFKDCPQITSFANTFDGCVSLTSLPVDLFRYQADVTTFEYAFAGCTALTTIPAGFIGATLDVSTNNMFTGCTGLTTIESGAFQYFTGAQSSFSSLFSGCTMLTSIPADLFWSSPNAHSFSYTFQGCSFLPAIPEGLFQYSGAAGDFTSTFSGCATLTSANLPSSLFQNCPYANTFNNCFNSCIGLTYVPAGLFGSNPLVTDFTMIFANCSGLGANSGDIPADLFAGNPAVTTFSNAFLYCMAMTEIPVDFFTYNVNVTAFDQCFYGCTALATIPEDTFRYNVLANDFAGTFVGCTSIASVPAGLFAYNVAATRFESVFGGCSFTEIPAGLFDNNVNAVTFNSAFSDCSGITTIPSDLFRYVGNPMFSNTFGHCQALTTIPDGLFSYNTGSNTFQGCFQRCDALTTIGANLFGNNTAVTTGFEALFAFCSNSLTTLPADLFAGCVNMVDLSQTFQECNSLTAIPADFLKYNTNLLALSATFATCTSLATVPADLLQYNVLVESLTDTFKGTALTSVPADFFKYNTAVTTFARCFQSCGQLQTLPADLFKYNVNAYNFQACFYNCNKLQERSDIFYASGEQATRFASIAPRINFTDCFRRGLFSGTQGTAPDLWACTFTQTPTRTRCWNGAGNSGTSLTNYASIPTAWK